MGNDDLKNEQQCAIHDVRQRCLLFANWLRVNFNNSPEEIDNYWEDIFYTIDNIRQKNYTTEELYEWWSNNVV